MMIEKFIEHIKNTPVEELNKEFEEINKEWGDVESPLAQDLVDSWVKYKKSYKITKERTENSNGRFCIVRNTWEIMYRLPYVRYHLLVENNNECGTIELDRKKQISYHCDLAKKIADQNGFESVQAFADHYKKDFDGFME